MWSQSRDMTAGKWDSGRTAATPHLLCRLFLEDKEQAGWPLAERADKINGFEMSSDNGPFRPLSGVILWLFFCMSCGNGWLETEQGQRNLRRIRGNIQTQKYSRFLLIISTPESTSDDSRVLSSHAEVASNIHQLSLVFTEGWFKRWICAISKFISSKWDTGQTLYNDNWFMRLLKCGSFACKVSFPNCPLGVHPYVCGVTYSH